MPLGSSARAALLECYDALSKAYGALSTACRIGPHRFFPALLLARVDGKSPVEYLTEENKRTVRSLARSLIGANTLEQVHAAWQRSST